MASHLTGGEVGFTGFFRPTEQAPGTGGGVRCCGIAAGGTDAAPCAARGAHGDAPATLSTCATCQAAHRAEARRRDGDIAPYRNGTAPRDTATGHEAKPRTAPRRGGAMGTSRPTATGPHHRARRWERGGASREGGEPPRAVATKKRALPQRDTSVGRGRCARRGGAARGNGVISVRPNDRRGW